MLGRKSLCNKKFSLTLNTGQGHFLKNYRNKSYVSTALTFLFVYLLTLSNKIESVCYQSYRHVHAKEDTSEKVFALFFFNVSPFLIDPGQVWLECALCNSLQYPVYNIRVEARPPQGRMSRWKGSFAE